MKIFLHAYTRARKAALVIDYFSWRNNLRLRGSRLPSLSHLPILDQINADVVVRRVNCPYLAIFIYPVCVSIACFNMNGSEWV